MRNGHISLGVFLAFFSGCIAGGSTLEADGIWTWIIVSVVSFLMLGMAFGRMDRGVKDELEKAELKRKAAQVRR